MRVRELLNNIEMQGEYKLVYFDYDKCERIEVQETPEIHDKYIKYMYSENDIIYIEFDNE